MIEKYLRLGVEEAVCSGYYELVSDQRSSTHMTRISVVSLQLNAHHPVQIAI